MVCPDLVWLREELRRKDGLSWEVLQYEVSRLHENDSKDQITHGVHLLKT